MMARPAVFWSISLSGSADTASENLQRHMQYQVLNYNDRRDLSAMAPIWLRLKWSTIRPHREYTPPMGCLIFLQISTSVGPTKAEFNQRGGLGPKDPSAYLFFFILSNRHQEDDSQALLLNQHLAASVDISSFDESLEICVDIWPTSDQITDVQHPLY